ncbi:uncharacterized protein LOC111021683 [Momordica charantia]|uniref:Uncharacterized protein LOC111021683 n=1 Tax=Momordica charantia TaxID=3673 RepID=A0A6J1DNM4_MOMCH|nr:uncharacterized protein LOC111021683 [Momordica charantia]
MEKMYAEATRANRTASPSIAPGAPGEKGAPSIQPGDREPIPNDGGMDYSLRDNDMRKHLTEKKKRASREPEDSLSYSRKFSNSNLKAQSKYKPLAPEAMITREEFDLMKHKFGEQVEALKARCEKKECSFDNGDLGESPFTPDILEAPIPPKFKTPTMKPYDGIAALNRFVSRSTDKCLPFFKVLREKGPFEWTEECEQALGQLKDYLCSAPPLAKPLPGEKLHLYLAVSASAVISALVKQEGASQSPIYYTSKAMTEAETRYPQMEKLALALVTAAEDLGRTSKRTRLRPYFQAHTVVVLTNLPLKNIFLKAETSGRLMKWALELSEYDIQFEHRTAMKRQAVADFIAELTPPPQSVNSDLPWTIFVDGSSNERGCEVGILLLAPGGERFEYALQFNFRTSNNEAEYEALLAGLRVAKGLGASHIKVFSDSQLIVNQIKEEYQTKDPRMEKYLSKVRLYLAHFGTYEVSQVPRSENSNADALAKLASAYEIDLARSVPVEILDTPSILEPDVMEVDTPSPTWMDPIVEFIKGNPPQDPKEQKKMARRADRFTLREGMLYRRGFSLPLLKYVTPEEGLYILREVHEGDAKQFVKACDNCQCFASIIHQPPELLTLISAPWPFAQWGVDIIGPCPLGKGQTKWVEAEALSHITESRVTSFIWTNIVCRFGIPNAIVTNNEKQFDNAKFKDFCRKLGISHLSSSPAHPKANGQVEAVNKIIK